MASRNFHLRSFAVFAAVATSLAAGHALKQTPNPPNGRTAPTVFFADSIEDRAAAGSLGAVTNSVGPSTYAVTKMPMHGTASISGSEGGSGKWSYQPEKGFIGTDEFQITANSGASQSVTRIVVLVNYEPTSRTLYVDAAKGSDKNSGTQAEPFATIQAASDKTKPGDTVLIKNGTYTQTSAEGVVIITRSGSPGAVITYRAAPGEHPILSAKTAWNHIVVTASWIRIQGLEIAGNAQNVPLADAEKVYERFASGVGPETYGPETSFAETNGITIRPINYKAPLAERLYPRHIEVLDNRIHDVQGGAISAAWADYVTVRGNRIRNAAGRAMYACSGISILGSQNTDRNNSTYKMIVQDNLVVAARTYVKWIATKAMSDGNGIILDSNRNEQDKGLPYKGRFLVANNIVLDSGGAGIQVFSSDNADVVFNTVLNNSLTPGLEYGQIWAHASSNLLIENNILVAGHDAKINQFFADNKNVVYDYNVYFGGRKPEMTGPHDVIADPKLVDLQTANLHLQPSSPAVDSGSAAFAVTKDFDQNPRPSGNGFDRGAFELQSH